MNTVYILKFITNNSIGYNIRCYSNIQAAEEAKRYFEKQPTVNGIRNDPSNSYFAIEECFVSSKFVKP